MRSTIDGAGRLVVPKALRDALDLRPGQELELNARDGRLEIEPVTTPMHIEGEGDDLRIVPDRVLPPLTDEQVRATLEQVRR